MSLLPTFRKNLRRSIMPYPASCESDDIMPSSNHNVGRICKISPYHFARTEITLTLCSSIANEQTGKTYILDDQKPRTHRQH